MENLINEQKSKEIAEMVRAEPKQCYRNSVMGTVFMDADYYVEGVAVMPCGIPFEHGWIEHQGEIIDPTLAFYDDLQDHEYHAVTRYTREEASKKLEETLPWTSWRELAEMQNQIWNEITGEVLTKQAET